jgi:hypothetical protein
VGAELLAPRADFRLQDFSLVGLTGISKLALRFRVILIDFCQVAMGVEQFLGGKDVHVTSSDRGLHANFLFFCFDLRNFSLFGKDLAIVCQLAAGHDGLLHEESLLASRYRAATNFISAVADGGIWIETGLLLAGFSGADFGFGLAQRWICFAG